MEYNKLHFHKINDHKVLHKVKKHWVVVSMALLSAMGATGLLHSQDVHASTNHALLTSNQQSAVNHGSSLAKVNQDQLHQRIVNSVQKLSPQRPQSIHTQINQLGRNAVQHGLNKQQSQNVSSNQGTDSASQSANVQQPAVGRTMSAPTVNHQQIVNAVKKDQQRQQRDANAKANLNQLDQRIAETAPKRETASLTEVGDDNPESPASVSSTVSSQLNDIANQCEDIDGYYGDVNSYNNTMQSSYNIAHLDVSRYYNSYTTSYNAQSSITSDNGGGSASEQLDSINSDRTSVAKILKPEVSASINASYISSVADNISMNVQTNGSAQNYSTQVSNLDSEIDSIGTTMSSGHSAISNFANDVSARTSSANSYVASASSQAATDASNVVANHNLKTAIVDVSTNKELEGAMYDGNIHQINIVRDMNMWYLTPGYGSSGENTSHANDITAPTRDLTINGLNEQGKWNVYDGAGSEWDLNGSGFTSTVRNNHAHLIIKNLHTYGSNFYGPFSFWGVNVGASPNPDSEISYKNFSYDGAQLNDSTGGHEVSEDFSGKITISVGTYSPSGKYQHYDYDNGGLSPVPYDEKDDHNGATTKIPDLAVPNGADSGDYSKYGVDLTGDQEVLEEYGNVTINPHCDFKGYTSDGCAVILDGQYSQFNVGHDAKVLLVPRGPAGEDDPNSPVGIYLRYGGTTSHSQINVGVGATLDIYPSVATNRFVPNAGNYCAPYAIYDAGSGILQISNGATVNINYPDIDKYTPADAGYSVKGNYSLPYDGVVYMDQGSITAEPYSSLIVNGGNPGTAYSTSYQSSLVHFDNPSSSAVQAQPQSTVRLVVGGTQPVTMFQAPGGDGITVTDPKEFSLDGSKNTNAQQATQPADSKTPPDTNFNIASTGVGIEANQIIAHDAITGKSFGQFARFALPGGQNAFPTGPLQTVDRDSDGRIVYEYETDKNGETMRDKKGNPIPKKDKNGHPVPKMVPTAIQLAEKDSGFGTAIGNYLPYALNPVFNQEGVDAVDRTIDFFDHDPESNIEYDGHELPISKGGFNFSQGFTFYGAPSTYTEGLNVQPMNDKGQPILLNDKNQPKSQPSYLLVSGYSNPGSYVKLRTLKGDVSSYNSANLNTDPMSSQLSAPVIINQTYFDNHKNLFGGASQLPSVFSNQVGDSGNAAEDENGLDDHDNNYAPNDVHHTGYIAIADNHTGAWSYKLPANFPTDSLVASNYNQTLEYPKAARLVTNYMDGANNVVNGWTNNDLTSNIQNRPADSSTNADGYDADPDNFPYNTYPQTQADGQVNNDPTGRDLDPTATDDDEAHDVEEGEVLTDKVIALKDGTDVNQTNHDIKLPDGHIIKAGTRLPAQNGKSEDTSQSDGGKVEMIYDPIEPNDRFNRQTDDSNAGQYFKAGYFKGLHDLLSMQKDNAISSMPEPFLIGYESAQLASMNPDASKDINKIIQDVERVKTDLESADNNDLANHYYTDYLPRINSDDSLTSSDVSQLNSTVSNLDTLASEVDFSSGANTTIGDLNSMNSSLKGSMANVDTNSGSILNDQSQVSSIDSDINQMLNSLEAAQAIITSGMDNYDAESRAAVRASNAGNANQATLDNTIALTNVSSVNNAISGAYPASSAADSEDSSASNFANSADNDYYGSKSSGSLVSNGVSQDNIAIRSGASNAEANDYTALTSGYRDWGTGDSSFISAEGQLARERQAQISGYNDLYTSATSVLNSFSDSLAAINLNPLPSAAQQTVQNIKNAITDEQGSLAAVSTANSTAGGSASTYNSNAQSALDDMMEQGQNLAMDYQQASNSAKTQGNYDSQNKFDLANEINSLTYDPQTSTGNLASAQANEASAVNDSSAAESAWDEIAGLIRRTHKNARQVGVSLVRLASFVQSKVPQLGASLPSNFGRNLLHAGQPRYSSIKIAYRDVNTGQILDSILVGGREGEAFSLEKYENNLPAGNHSYAGVEQGADVSQFQYNNGQPQKVIIDVASAYGLIRVHFVQADSINAANRHQPSSWTVVPHSVTATLTGKVGDVFSPEQYEYNTPKNTEFAYLAGGGNIGSYQPRPQDIYIAVKPTNHRF